MRMRSILALLLALVVLGFGIRACTDYFLRPPVVYHLAINRDWQRAPAFEKQRNFSAFSIDLLRAIADYEEIDIELKQADPQDLMPRLAQGSYDGVLALINPDGGYQGRYLFSDPLYPTGPVVIVRPNSTLSSLPQLAHKHIGILQGSSAASLLSGFPDILITTYETPQQALSSLELDKIDAVILDLIQANTYLSGLYASKLKIVTAPLTKEGLCIVAMPTEKGEELITAINDGLKELKSTSLYRKLLDRWSLYFPQ